MKDKLLKGLSDLLAPIVKILVKEVLDFAWGKVNEQDPIALKTALVAIYGPTDVYLEDMVEKTETEIDDSIVQALMESAEDAAELYEFELPQLDDD